MATQREYTYQELQNEIDAGKLLIVYDLKVLDCTAWAKVHPGGELAIRHATRRDATDMIRIYHPKQIYTEKIFNYQVGTLKVGKEEAHIFNNPMSMELRKVHEELISKGYFDVNIPFYARYIAFYLSLAALSITLIQLQPTYMPNWPITTAVLSALLMTFMWQQIAFFVHDAGHHVITYSRKVDSILGILVGNCLGGSSLAWWKGRHNIHHLVTNDPRHDPVIQQLPFFAISERFFSNIYSSFRGGVIPFGPVAKFFIPRQHLLYYIDQIFYARVLLYIISFARLVRNKAAQYRWLEFASLVVYWAWFLTFMSTFPTWQMMWVFLFISHGMYFIVQVQVNQSHFSMPVYDMPPEEDWGTHQYKTTLDVDCPEWLDWLHGGLQFQVIHHLFPRIQRRYLRRATQEIVVPFAAKHGLTYHHETFSKGNRQVLGRLRDVAEQARFFIKVAQHEAANPHHHHD